MKELTGCYHRKMYQLKEQQKIIEKLKCITKRKLNFYEFAKRDSAKTGARPEPHE